MTTRIEWEVQWKAKDGRFDWKELWLSDDEDFAREVFTRRKEHPPSPAYDYRLLKRTIAEEVVGE